VKEQERDRKREKVREIEQKRQDNCVSSTEIKMKISKENSFCILFVEKYLFDFSNMVLVGS
jgi:hypothetical protein